MRIKCLRLLFSFAVLLSLSNLQCFTRCYYKDHMAGAVKTFDSMKVAELKLLLSNHGQPTKGKKTDLIARLDW